MFRFSSVAQLCLTLQPHGPHLVRPTSPSPNPRVYSYLSIESVMSSNHLILCHPLLIQPTISPIISIFSNESALSIRWPKYWSFSFNISPSNEHLGLISLKWSSLISLQSKGLSRVFSNTTVQQHQFFSAQLSYVQLSHPYTTTGKTIALTRWTLVSKVMSLLFNMLSAAAAKSLQSRLTLCDPIDGSPPGSPIPGILQARPLEWVAISFSNV